jgi:hypothetical protein
MAESEVVFAGTKMLLPRRLLWSNCELFDCDPTLLASPYTVRSRVPRDVFDLFIESLRGIEPTITAQNATPLSQLCQEFGCPALAAKVSDFLTANPLPGEVIARTKNDDLQGRAQIRANLPSDACFPCLFQNEINLRAWLEVCAHSFRRLSPSAVSQGKECFVRE